MARDYKLCKYKNLWLKYEKQADKLKNDKGILDLYSPSVKVLNNERLKRLNKIFEYLVVRLHRKYNPELL